MQGKRAFIGVGFKERSDAFDFNVALQDFIKYKSGASKPSAILSADYTPKDYSLKEGQTITVKLKTSKKTDGGGDKEKSQRPSTTSGGLSLSAPPPKGNPRGRRRRGKKVRLPLQKQNQTNRQPKTPQARQDGSNFDIYSC